MCNTPGCIDILSNNAITLFTSKCLLFRDLDKFAQLQPNYAIISFFKGSVWSKKSFPFFAENMTIRSILNLWWHSETLKLILGAVRGIFTKRLKGTRRLLYTVKSDFFRNDSFTL